MLPGGGGGGGGGGVGSECPPEQLPAIASDSKIGRITSGARRRNSFFASIGTLALPGCARRRT
jgi:hypothetical protein